LNRTPTLGNPLLCVVEVWRYGSGRAEDCYNAEEQ
jgi:hypothetical protein